MEQFRVGAFYKQTNGVISEVLESCSDGFLYVRTAWAPAGKELEGGGARRASNGRYSDHDKHSKYTILPGEMHQVSGQWVPITSLPADATEQAEIDAAKCQPAHVSHVEPERAELPYFRQRTEFDPFKGWFHMCASDTPEQPKLPTHPLQKMNEGGNALHGSAWLLPKT
jgi:hypothetical protein